MENSNFSDVADTIDTIDTIDTLILFIKSAITFLQQKSFF